MVTPTLLLAQTKQLYPSTKKKKQLYYPVDHCKLHAYTKHPQMFEPLKNSKHFTQKNYNIYTENFIRLK